MKKEIKKENIRPFVKELIKTKTSDLRMKQYFQPTNTVRYRATILQLNKLTNNNLNPTE